MVWCISTKNPIEIQPFKYSLSLFKYLSLLNVYKSTILFRQHLFRLSPTTTEGFKRFYRED